MAKINNYTFAGFPSFDPAVSFVLGNFLDFFLQVFVWLGIVQLFHVTKISGKTK